jgi:ABC-type transport system involved in cytochrome c biogenesis permease subunit
MLLERNPATYESHRREVFRQITIPLIIGVVLLVAACGAIVWGSFWVGGDASRWADISLIWLILPAMLATLVFLLVTGGLVYLTVLLIARLPPLFLKLFNLFTRINAALRRAADKAVEPVLRVESWKAGWKRLRRVRG